ncbi:MYO9A protein, partial [Semnornis frantzii]|nr:MYO9A protein [Semnornis frantzii]
PPAGADGNLAALSELDEAVLLDGLRERFLRQHVYVSAGGWGRGQHSFTVSFFLRQVSERYRHHEKGKLPPHIFAVASRAYHAMLGRGGGGTESQCIVI